MVPDQFPGSGPGGEEPGGSGPLPAGGSGPPDGAPWPEDDLEGPGQGLYVACPPGS
jgi:hypothetical protein